LSPESDCCGRVNIQAGTSSERLTVRQHTTAAAGVSSTRNGLVSFSIDQR